MRSLKVVRAAGIVVVVLLLAGCINTSPIAAPSGDAELVAGQQVFASQCASCHGVQGQGGRGTQLSDGSVLSAYPNPADQLDLVVNGRGQMPAYGKRLSEEQLAAVVRYTREVINTAGTGE